MVALRPTTARVVRPEFAARVVAPPYDALRLAERERLAAVNRDSFLNVIPSASEGSGSVEAPLEAAGAALARLLALGCYGEPIEAVFIYRLRSPEHEQTAVTADIPAAAVDEGLVRPHERTRTGKEDELTRHLRRLRLNSSPVGLTYRPSALVDSVVTREVAAPPLLDVTTDDGVHQTVWALGPGASAELVDAFAEVGAAYIVDGHHRVAATRRTGTAAFLGALVPTDQLRLLPYHRLVTGPVPLGTEALVSTLGAAPASADEAPGRPGEVLLRAGRRWWRFELDVGEGRRLDVAALEADVLVGLLGMADPRSDPRLDVVAGHVELGHLGDLADEAAGLAFALHPPTVAQLLDEADAGRTMPPKSTWFEPKLRSGVFLVRR